MKRILVTGGAGYIGSVLARKLLESGYEVTVLDALIYSDAGVRRLRDQPHFRLIHADICERAALQRALAGVDSVVHLAAIANDPSGELDRALTRKVNLDSYPMLLEAAAQAGAKRFVNMSSISVYGKSDRAALTEDDPVNPLTEYAVCKAEAETVVKQFNSAHFATVTLRGGTVCGWSPRMRFDLCANTLAAQAVARKELTIWGGAQQRPQIHIEDLTDFIVCTLTSDSEKIGGRTFNAAGHNVSVREIGETIHAVMNGTLRLMDGPARADERSYNVSSEKLSKELGLRPQRTIKDAVVQIIGAHRRGWWSDPDDALYHNVKRMLAMEKTATC